MYNCYHLGRCFCRCSDVLSTDTITYSFTLQEDNLGETQEQNKPPFRLTARTQRHPFHPRIELSLDSRFPRTLKDKQFNHLHKLLSYRQEETFSVLLPTAKSKAERC